MWTLLITRYFIQAEIYVRPKLVRKRNVQRKFGLKLFLKTEKYQETLKQVGIFEEEDNTKHYRSDNWKGQIRNKASKFETNQKEKKRCRRIHVDLTTWAPTIWSLATFPSREVSWWVKQKRSTDIKDAWISKDKYKAESKIREGNWWDMFFDEMFLTRVGKSPNNDVFLSPERENSERVLGDFSLPLLRHFHSSLRLFRFHLFQ